MDVWEVIGLFGAAFVAGAINAVAGGGSLITFPALLAFGYASKPANVTNTVGLWPGTVGGSWGYREEIGRQRSRVLKLALPSALGAIAGSAILLATPQSAFDVVVPFLIVFAVLLMAFQDALSDFALRNRFRSEDAAAIPLALTVATFSLAVYGAYFGAGFGILTLAVFAILIPDDIQHSNALKGLQALLVNGIAVVYFALFGPVKWGPAAAMAIGAVMGGYLGVGVARRLGRQWLRLAVIAYGSVVAVVLFVQLLTS
jgi:uncharacterized membrane protein YfcA